MPGLNVQGKHLTKVADFYQGKSVFVTGASGIFGSVLLEILLSCCPGIKSIYILLRQKKNIKPEARKEQIFNKKIFKRVKEKDTELLHKVQIIAGDTSYSNLKMSEEDIQLLIKEVSVVFHCAASTNFTETLKVAVRNNALSVHNVIELCKKMMNLEALVYTSTAYCNSNHTNVLLKEEVYRLPFRADSFLDALQNEDDKKLQTLFSHCKPEWPNMYTFSKCLAENIILDTASDLPIAIIRPSVIFSTWKQPIPGYEMGRSAPGAFFFGIGKGLLKVAYADPNFIIDLVPADIVANAHLLVSYCLGTKRCPSPAVFHCTATEEFRVPVSKYAKVARQMALKFPFPQAFMMPSECIIIPNKFLYFMAVVYYHYLPAIVLEGMLRILGKKSKIFSSYRALEAVFTSCGFLQFQSYEFERKNLERIDKLIYPQDRNELFLDFRNATFIETALKIPEGSPLYDCKTDEKSATEGQMFKYRCHLVVKFIQSMFLIILNLLLYWIFSVFFL